MADLGFVALALAFFGLAYLYVLGCDRIIGRDATALTGEDAGGTEERSEAQVRS